MYRWNMHVWKTSLTAAAAVAFVVGCGQQGAGPVATNPNATPVAANDAVAEDAQTAVTTCTLSVDTMT